MTNLLSMARADRAIATITAKELTLISCALIFIERMAKSMLLRWFLPPELKDAAFSLRMIAAAIGRNLDEIQPEEENVLEAMKRSMFEQMTRDKK